MNKKLTISLLAVGCLRLASASTVSSSLNNAETIPDYANSGLSGISQSITLNGTGIQDVTDVQLTLDITGGFNGDYYAYLEHGSSPIAILLNRVGLDGQNRYGYNNGGFDVTFSDSALNGNIHTYQTLANPGTGPITGTWQPDGRAVSPFSVSTSTPVTAPLSVLDGGSGDGAWTLFIADASEGGIGTLTGWSLTVTGTGASVPDGTDTLVLLGLTAGGLALAYWRGQPKLAQAAAK